MPRNVDTLEQVSPGTEAVETAQHIHERRFAATARPHDGHELSLPNHDADTAERMHTCFTKIVVLVEVFRADDRGSGGDKRRSGLVDGRHRINR